MISDTKQPIRLTFASRVHLWAYSDDPQAFVDSFLKTMPQEIVDIQCGAEVAIVPELVEVTLHLESGSNIICYIAKTDVAKADYIQEIVKCEQTHMIALSNVLKDHDSLQERLIAVTNVITNIPNDEVRIAMLKDFMKRKTAYVAALESLVDGWIRRPDNE
jgi:CTP synthase (UTP-ammonia lyase)